jgi:4-amino-4-deoxy-L-arabinose transferase-like glycosyltransferase
VLAAIVALGLALRVALVLLAAGPSQLVTSDGQTYLRLARNLRAGYLDTGSRLFDAGLLYPPGYPLFAAAALGIAQDSVRGLALAQVGIAGATLVMLFLLGRRLLGDEPTALFAALLLALDPASALYCVVSQPEALFTGLVVASALAWSRALQSPPGWAIVAGLLLGIAMWVRPIGLFLPVPVAATALLLGRRGERLRLVAFLLAPPAVFAATWIARNQAVTGSAFFAGIEGNNGLYYRAAGALAVSEGIPIEVAKSRLLDEETRRGFPELPAGERIRQQVALMREVLVAHPWGAARAALQGWLRLFAGTGLSVFSALRGDPDPEGVSGNKQLAGVALALPNAALLLGTLLALVHWRQPEQKALLTLSAAFVLYFLAASSFLEANTRFRVPMVPFLALLGARGWTRAWRGIPRSG